MKPVPFEVSFTHTDGPRFCRVEGCSNPPEVPFAVKYQRDGVTTLFSGRLCRAHADEFCAAHSFSSRFVRDGG